jgi:DNA-binding transcriptional regulator YiaG
MTPRQLNIALVKLGMTQMGFAKIIGVADTTVRDWVGGRTRIPGAVAALLNLMLDTKSTAEDLRI